MTNSKLLTELEEIKKRLDAQTPRPLTLPEAALFLGLSRSRLYFLTSKRLIPFYRPNGKRIYFRQEDLTNWMLRNRNATRDELAAQVQSQ